MKMDSDFIQTALLTGVFLLLGVVVGLSIVVSSKEDRIAYLETESALLRRKNAALSEYAEQAMLGQELAEAQLEYRGMLPVALTAEYAGEFKLTSYCTEKREHICGTGDGITKSGAPVSNLTVAADLSVFPMGTVLYIDGVGIRVVQDIGGAIKGNHLDVAIEGTHENALRWPLGNSQQKVWVLK
jgi:3D (Asp-Asp-Asp) domain-containing protein